MQRKPQELIDHPVIVAIHDRLDKTDARMDRIESGLIENTSMTKEIHEWLSAGKSGLKVLGMLAKLFGWMISVVAGISAIYGGYINWLKK